MHGKDVVDQVAVNAAVSVLELMDVDKAEGEDCGGDDCIKVLRWALIERTSITTSWTEGVARQDIVGADRRPS
ncbi:hypothetical protein BAE39_26955 [Mesorhizobium loti]|uniref:Uncharacterized protein n=1 Tax=Rhizobium loti TaxID=381 RepID=A0A1A5JZM6_RHILI|nr:hypothetical protein A9174_32910 [Mesorhizobium loti NZP2037]OBP77779.1 hypothetical protein BAE41_31190 [Mesorhizobium loti]OBP79970.1 hypothetical protein BAE39_26955 [Mesorhizobium loti]OBP96868.1 hypothetical protein BAE38_26560 [Mesorhizobium loti]OBQ59031.1 hypothetical protein A8145_25585 [Mesorhizobium loti]